MNYQPNLDDPADDGPPARDWRDPTVREREAAAKSLAASRAALRAVGARNVPQAPLEDEPGGGM